MTVSTRMAIMDGGRVIQVGPPAEIYQRPATRFVADFVGQVNMVEARVVEAGDRSMRLEAPDLGCEVVSDRPVPAAVGETVWVAVRPETIAMTTAAAGGACEPRAGHGVEHRLPGRPLDLPRPAADGGHGPGQRREPEPPRRAASRPGRRGLAELAAGRRRRAAVVSAGSAPAARGARGRARAAAADPDPLRLAGRPLPRAVRDRAEDQPLAADDRDPALPAALAARRRRGRPDRAVSASTFELTTGSSPTASTAGLPQLAAPGRDRDGAGAARRAADRLRDGLGAGALARRCCWRW